jgi:hypothetical protein
MTSHYRYSALKSQLAVAMLAIVCWFHHAPTLFAQDNDRRFDEELVQRELDLNEAFVSNEPRALAQFLAPSWRHVAADGSVMTYSQMIEFLKNGRLSFDRRQIRRLSVRTYRGDFAVVTGVAEPMYRWEGRSGGGIFRYTSVWVRESEGWKAVSFHTSRIEGDEVEAVPADSEASGGERRGGRFVK